MPKCCRTHRDQIWLTFLTVCIAYAGADILVFSSISRHQIEEEFRDAPARFGGLIPSEGIQVSSILNLQPCTNLFPFFQHLKSQKDINFLISVRIFHENDFFVVNELCCLFHRLNVDSPVLRNVCVVPVIRYDTYYLEIYYSQL